MDDTPRLKPIKKKTRYAILYFQSHEDLVNNVNNALAFEWNLYGSPFDYKGYICQAMTREEEE